MMMSVEGKVFNLRSCFLFRPLPFDHVHEQVSRFYDPKHLRPLTVLNSNPKVASLAARLVEPNYPQHHKRNQVHEEDDEDEEAIFAELEAEIENDSNAVMREHGLEVLRRE